jgi:1,2-diacylglycerol 3-alpha-glucosyltransferase
MTHIVVIFSNFGPYHVGRIQAFHNHCISKGWKVTAIELARFENEYPWQIDLKSLPFPLISLISQTIEEVSFYQILSELYRVLTKIKPDVVAISGYARPTIMVLESA